MDLNDIVRPQDVALKQIATIFPNEKSTTKMPYAGDKSFSFKDISKLLTNIGKMKLLMGSLRKSISLINKNTVFEKHWITEDEFYQLKQLIKTIGVHSIGLIEMTPDRVFKDKGVPYRFALIITINMD